MQHEDTRMTSSSAGSTMNLVLPLGWVLLASTLMAFVTGIVPMMDLWTALPADQFFSSAMSGVVFAFLLASPGRRTLLVALGLQLVLMVSWVLVFSPLEPLQWWQAIKWTGAIASFTVLGTVALTKRREARGFRAVEGLAAASLLPGFVLVSFFFLALTVALFPTTYDGVVYAVDGTFGRQLSFDLSLAFGGSWFVTGLLAFVYFELPLATAALLSLSRLQRGLPSLRIMQSFLGLAVAGYSIYLIFPVAGPAFAFPEFFPYHAPNPDSLSLTSMLVMPVPRNCMPSLHTGWALLLFWHSRGHSRWVQRATAFWLAATMLATLVLGFHYFVDLVAAWPLTLVIYTLTVSPGSMDRDLRRRSIVVGLSLTAIWLILARHGLPLLGLHPVVPWGLSLATFAVVERLRWRLQDGLLGLYAEQAAGISTQSLGSFPAKEEERAIVRGFMFAFLISGIAGLVYEVVFSKKLALIFGSTTVAITLVLATFMGGMALGSWFGGRLTGRLKDHLRAYAVCEFGIGLFCLATPLWTRLAEGLYLALAPPVLEDTLLRSLLQLGVGSIFLLPPTILMGMTLPILAEFLVRRHHTLGRATGLLYGANTAGAAIGSLGAGYFLLPVFGISQTVVIAFVLNLLAVLVALQLRKRLGTLTQDGVAPGQISDAGHASAAETNATGVLTAPAGVPELRRRVLGWVCMAALGIGGVVSFQLETTYFHLLNLVAASSAYSFSLMLATFLTGLSLGAWVARRFILADRRRDWVRMLAVAWLVLAAVLWLGNRLWQELPSYFASFQYYPATRTFASRELVRGLVCSLAMLPPAFAIGLAYPLAMEGVGRAWPAGAVVMLGRGAALNTVGNIVGTVLASFFLLPLLGSLNTVRLAAFAAIGIGLFFLPFLDLRARLGIGMGALSLSILLFLLPARFDLDRLASGAHIYFEQQSYGRVIDHDESPDSGLVTVAESWNGRQHVRTLLTNGKFEGDDNPDGELRAQFGFALFPLVHQPARSQALLIGLGTGTTAGVLARAGFEQLTIAELSPAILRFARKYFSKVNAGVLDRPNVRVRVTDGRNLLFLSPERYDLVSLELTSIWLPGQAAFYNQDFYRLARRRLLPGGVLQQWMQLHRLNRRDLLSIIATLRSVFPEVWLYYSSPGTVDGGQGVLVACLQACPPTDRNLQLLEGAPELGPALLRMGGQARQLSGYLLLDPAGIDRMIQWANKLGWTASDLISTDDNLLLEYATPKANVRPYLQSLQENFIFLSSFSKPDPISR